MGIGMGFGIGIGGIGDFGVRVRLVYREKTMSFAPAMKCQILSQP
jgi:hypothetical protein